MSILPSTSESTISKNLTKKSYKTFTYKINNDISKIDGDVDYLDAMKQVMYLIINTDRYKYPIFSSSYGIDLRNIVGKETDFIIAELQSQLSDCVLDDSRFLSVDYNSHTEEGDVLSIQFDISTIYGDFVSTTIIN